MSKTIDTLTPRHTNAISRQLGDELIVYDADTHRAYTLNQTAALVWKSCDGKTKVASMVRQLQKMVLGIDDRILLATLIQLKKSGLLIEGTFPLSDDVRSLSRRNLLRKIGKAAAVAMPIVTSIVVPTPAMAVSCFQLGHLCNKNSDCCSTHCVLGLCVV
jgi:hypothetical protein